MTSVYLYGELQNKFGSEFKFKINSPKEAFLAINSNRKGFIDEVKKLAIQGVHYRIVIDENIIENPRELEITKIPKEIHIVPIVWGAGRNGALIAIGIVLTILTYGAAASGIAAIGSAGSAASGAAAAGGAAAGAAAAGGVTFTALGSSLMMLGVGIALQGVMGLLYPQPKPDFNQEVQAGGKSYLFGNKPPNMSQGQAVPVGYGRLKIGSSQISASVDHYALTTDIKQLMTPVDKPINDTIQVIASDEAQNSSAGLTVDAFSTEQAIDMEDTVIFESVNILNSYINVTSNSAETIFTNPVEVVVKKNGIVVSNPNLTTWDEDITYDWQTVSNAFSEYLSWENQDKFNFKNGIVTRTYNPVDFKVKNSTVKLQGQDLRQYSLNEIVKYGPNQFEQLNFAKWDKDYTYYSGDLVNYETAIGTYFQAIQNNFFDQKPTGEGNTINSTYWRKILPPPKEYLYKCIAAGGVSGNFPTTGILDVDGEPVAESTYWEKITMPINATQMDSLFNNYPNCQLENQVSYQGDMYILGNGNGISTPVGNTNYGTEFLGYFYVPSENPDNTRSPEIKEIYELGTSTGLYEIIKIGETGQWSGIGLTGINGVALTPQVGLTFHKNNTQGTQNGLVMRIGDYQFKLDSDDAADLFIDSTLASSYYGSHGMFSGFADPFKPTQAEITALHSTTTPLYLTAGYHRLYARLQQGLGGEGITVYYRYDTNRDGAYSDWKPLPKSNLFCAAADFLLPVNQKFSTVGKKTISVADMVAGKRYKIHTLGSTNWTSVGSAINNTQTVFRSTGSTTGGGLVTEDFITYSESKSAKSNRLIRFKAKRKDKGYASYKAQFKCKVIFKNKTALNSSPVKVNVNFLQNSIDYGRLTSVDSLTVSNI